MSERIGRTISKRPAIFVSSEEGIMKTTRSSTLIPLAVLIAFSLPAAAQKDAGQQGASPDFAALEAAQNATNAMPGPRTVPGRSIPVPTTASPELQATIAAPYRVPNWNANPKNAAEWKELSRWRVRPRGERFARNL